MDRPTPKELVVTRPSSASMLWITVSSHDAAAWVEQEAPLFGRLHKPTFETHYTLFVADTHDTDEVKRYLESYGGVG